MAIAVAEAIRDNAILVAEAGTGTGKTFAYLVPALLAGGKVVISTGTKNLQDQLFQKDLPMVRDALKAPVSVALLKGRSNYVCHYHLALAQSNGLFKTREDVKHLAKIVNYAKVTQSGDKSGLADVPENAPIWMHVTSTRDNCLGQECPQHEECFVLKARKEAMEADVVVVNHHLFFADVMLRDEGVAELLPACNTVIFDEAHQLPETASLFFGESLSTSQLFDLSQDARIEALSGAKDFAALPVACDELDKAARDVRLAFKKEGRMAADATESIKDFAPALKTLGEKLKNLTGLLEKQAERSEGLENCWQRARVLVEMLKVWQQEKSPPPPPSPEGRGSQVEAKSEGSLSQRGRAREGESAGVVRWLEVFHHSLQLNTTPLSIADIFKKQLSGHPRAWIFTSATLAVKQNFSHYQNEMGLTEARTACWDSPFNYQEQALLYVPQNLPEPNSEGYTDAVVQAALPLIEASRGPRLPALHQLACHATCLRNPASRVRPQESEIPAVNPGRRLAQRVAHAFPRTRQRGAAGQPVVLGRGGCARRSIVAGHHRQAAVRAAGRSGAGGAHCGAEPAGTERVHGIPVATRRHQPQTGCWSANPR